MVFKYSTLQEVIDARQRIATAEGLPKFENSKTLYYLNFQEIDGNYYIDARGEEMKPWYSIETMHSTTQLIELPDIPE